MKKLTRVERVPTDAEWDAVIRSDSTADGTFFIGVLSTGIYCKPSCGARKPFRKNVVVFNTPLEAEAAGFRACYRCHPKSPYTLDREFQTAILDYLYQNRHRRVTLKELSGWIGLSPTYVQRRFKALTGQSPYQAAKAIPR